MLLITGATGNTGSLVVSNLRRRMPDLRLLALVRPGSDRRQLDALGVAWHECDLTNPSTYLPVVEPGSRLLEIANIRIARNLLGPMIQAGVTHAFCVTTTGVFSHYKSYSALYQEIEAEFRSMPIPVTLLRPSMIYGNARDHNMHRLIGFLERYPVFPIFGPGTALMQPVHVEDLAEGITRAVERSAHGEFNLAGPVPIPYRVLIDTVIAALNRQVRVIHVDHRLAASAASLLQHIPGFPVRHEQVMRLLEDKAFDISSSVSELGYEPRPFAVGIANEVAALRGERLL